VQQTRNMLALGVLAVAVAVSIGCESGGSSGGGGSIQASTDGANGFLWKPKSESNGNLVVLLPTQYRGQVESVGIHRTNSTSTDTLIEAGWFAGDTHNGARPHFRFADSGGSYGADIWLIAKLADGQALSYNIPNGAARWD